MFKSLNIKMESNLKEAGAYDEVKKWKKMEAWKYASGVIVFVLGFFGVWPAVMVMRGHPEVAVKFFGVFWEVVLHHINAMAFLQKTYVPLFVELGTAPGFPDLRVLMPMMVWVSFTVGIPLAVGKLNTYNKTPNIFGNARWARDEDIDVMASRDLAGFEDWTYTLKYRWADFKKRVKHRLRRIYSRDARGEPLPGRTNRRKTLFILGKFNNRLLRMGETLSVLLLAPPGTGKSVGFIVPSIVELDHSSLFVHDQKPELWDMTAGHRQKVGPCFLLKWSAEDQPGGMFVDERQAMTMDPSILITENGKVIKDPETGLFKTIPLFYPTWNPLSLQNVPPAGVNRGSYINRLAQTLCPDKSEGNSFFTSKARMMIAGFTHLLVHVVEAAMSDDMKWRWDIVPHQWRNCEPSFPALVDFFAYGQSNFSGDDPMRDFLSACVNEAKALDKEFYRVRGITPMNTAIVELTNLMATNATTRGSIISTFDEAMGPFKIESVRQRTSSSDLSFSQLRGIPKPEARKREEEKIAKAKKDGKFYKAQYKKGEWDPVTVYVSVDLQNARTFSTITSIFIDSANAYLVSNDWNAVDEQGNQLGPFPFTFLIDEAPQLGKLDTIMNGPAVGRSKHISYVIVGQDFAQFETKYSKPEVETLKSTTAIKIVLTQNNENTAKQVAEMAGKFTYQKTSHSDKPAAKGIEGMINGKGKSASESYEGVEFLKPSFLMSMPQDKHVVLVQNYMNRPIFCDTPKFFLEKKKRKFGGAIVEKVLNLRSFVGPKPGAPMPLDLMDLAAERSARLKVQMKAAQEAAEKEAQEKAAKEAAEKGQTTEGMSPGDRLEAAVRSGMNAAADARNGVAGSINPQLQAQMEAMEANDDMIRTVVILPSDVATMARDEDSRLVDSDVVHPFIVFNVDLPESSDDIEPPIAENLLVTTDVAKVREFIGNQIFFIFSAEAMNKEVTMPLAKMGLPAPVGRPIFVRDLAIEAQEKVVSDIYTMGLMGGARQDYPGLGAEPDKWFIARWYTQELSFLIATQITLAEFEMHATNLPEAVMAEYERGRKDAEGEGGGDAGEPMPSESAPMVL